MEMKTKLQLVGSGIAAGFVNGFLGGGGGIIAVPLLAIVMALPAKKAHATAIFVILPLSIASAAVYLFNGSVDWRVTLLATAGVVGGGVIGALLLNKLDNNVVKLIFSVFLMAAGVRMFLSS